MAEQLGLATAGKAAYAALEPSDLLNKHAWLFRDAWVEESADEIEEIEEAKIDFREARGAHQEAEDRGVARNSCAARSRWDFGALRTRESFMGDWRARGSAVLSEHELQELLRLALAPIPRWQGGGPLVQEPHRWRVARLVDDDKREAVLKGCSGRIYPKRTWCSCFVLAPFGRSTWKLVDALGEVAQAKYWSEVTPDWIHDSDAENS